EAARAALAVRRGALRPGTSDRQEAGAEPGMKSEDNAELSLAIAADRRALQRFDTDGAASLLLTPERIMQGRLTDLSLGGCRLRTVERFKAEPGLQVQVAFRVNGLTFKFAGITEW